MSVSMEQVEKLHEKSGASYADCKDALERSVGDILEALLDLERQGKSVTGTGGGAYTTRPAAAQHLEAPLPAAAPAAGQENAGGKRRTDLEGTLRAFWQGLANIFRHASANRLEVWQDEALFTSVPVAVVILLALVAFWVTLPLLAAGLFLGCRYRLIGPDVSREPVNDALDSLSDAARKLAERIKSGEKKEQDKK